jgi:glycosyltransferase involved in cell wall biosynthesis
MNNRLRVAKVTNIPAPYRQPIYEALAAVPDIDLQVIFCSGREPDRAWNLDRVATNQVFLRERFLTWRGRYIHFNPDVWSALHKFDPDVVVTTGYNPTHLLAFLYTRLKGKRHVVMTDGTLRSEQTLSWIHRWVRRRVFAGSAAFVGASEGSFALFREYGIADTLMFKSHLCANNATFAAQGEVAKRFDFMFCGRIVSVKNPHFALDVAQAVARRLGRRTALLVVGSGEAEAAMRRQAERISADVEVEFAGFARQEALPGLYAQARIFLFPTSWDPWGVVGNEACAAGLPLLVSPEAGVAGELVRDDCNGFVLALEVPRWVDAAVCLLTDEPLYQRMSADARQRVAPYSFQNAAAGLSAALRQAMGQSIDGDDRADLRPWPQRPSC